MSTDRVKHAWESTGKSEELLLERYPVLGSGKRATKSWFGFERNQEDIDSYEVGDLYLHSFSTTSPPAFVRHEYIVTRKDGRGLWGRLLQGEVEEFTREDIE